MSRARDMANLGAQAGSGLDASDITTGTLGNTVQDNITRLGTVVNGTLNINPSDNIIGDVSSAFNGVGMPLAVSHNETNTEHSPSDTNWYSIVSITHTLRHTDHYVLAIGGFGWSAHNSMGQMSIQGFKPNGSTNFDANQKVYQGSTGTNSLRNSISEWISSYGVFYGMYKPGNTDANVYRLMMAQESGTNFYTGLNNASRSWIMLIECTGVA